MPEPKLLCSACHRPVQGNRPKCMYCGAPVAQVQVAVVGPEAKDPVAAIGAQVEALRRAPPPQPMTPAQREAAFEAAKARISGLLDAGQLEASLAAFDAALALMSSPHLLLAKAQVLKNLKRPAPALACLDEALKLDRMLVDAWFEKGDVEALLGHVPQARECFTRFLAMDPPAEQQPQMDHARKMLAKLGK